MFNPMALDNTLDITLRIFPSNNGSPRVGYWIIEEKTGNILFAGFAINDVMARCQCLTWARKHGYSTFQVR